MSDYISGLDPLPGGEVPRPAENPDNPIRNKPKMTAPFVDHARTAGRAADVAALAACAWCGHVHDPEDDRCDSHANVGMGRCTCPGEGLVVAYDKVNAALYVAEQDCAELRGLVAVVAMKPRLRLVAEALWYGLLPWRVYERECHYACSYWRHAAVNVALAWRWATWTETAEDRAFAGSS